MNLTETDRAYLRTLTLLYVEDVPVVREYTRQALEPVVGRILMAGDGASGLEAFRKERPHLVVTDIVMPAHDGLSMAQAIRALDPEVPIIVTTAYDNTDFLVRSIDLGIEKYVFKPVDLGTLKEALLVAAHRMAAEEELARRREREAEQMRQQHHEAMRTLARGMGHDFNNLLQGILGAVSVAKLSTPASHQLHGILDMAEGSANQARELGRKLICLAKGEGPQDHAADLAPLLRSTVEGALRARSVTPSFDLAQGPLVCFDEQDMRMLVDLLVTNALEAMPGGGTFKVSTRLCDLSRKDGLPVMPGPYLRCSFQDSGLGVPEEILTRVFDPYFTTKTVKNQKGVGLSLTICQAIARAHGGALTVENRHPGADFLLYLPMAMEGALTPAT